MIICDVCKETCSPVHPPLAISVWADTMLKKHKEFKDICYVCMEICIKEIKNFEDELRELENIRGNEMQSINDKYHTNYDKIAGRFKAKVLETHNSINGEIL